MNKFLLTLLAFSLIACGGKSSNENNETAIWNTSSQRILVTQDNGNVLNSTDRYQAYDFSLDSLPIDAINKIYSILTLSNELTCVNDAVTYEVTITDEIGTEKTYHSSNNACNSDQVSFIDVSEIASLIATFPN